MLIDVVPSAHDRTLAFWAAATGREPSASGDHDEYAALGLVFCVVPVQQPDAFERTAPTWP